MALFSLSVFQQTPEAVNIQNQKPLHRTQILKWTLQMVVGLGIFPALPAISQDQTAVQTVALSGTEIDLNRLASLSKGPILRQLKLDGAPLSDEGLAMIASLSSLEELSLERCECSDRLFEVLADSKKLKRLRLRSLSLSDLGLVKLSALDRLELLEITDCTGFSQLGLESIASLTKLRSLTLSGQSVGDSVLLKLKSLSNITSLALRHAPISNEGFRVLEHFPKLKELDVYGTSVSSDFLANIPYPASLIKMKLRSTSIASKQIVQGIARFENVSALDLGENDLDATAIGSIAQLEKLEDLNLLRTKLSKDAVRILCESPANARLKKLNLDDNSAIDDMSIDSLLILKSLEFLHLGKTQVTDTGIQKLSSLAQLKTLIVNDTAVTQESLQLLQSALPNLRIVR